MMAAIRAAECGAKVMVLEKNSSPGRKLMITGKGRCNLTNAETDPREIAAVFGKQGRFLLTGLYAFGAAEMIAWCEENGVPVKTERGGRVFPQSDKAQTVLDLLTRKMKELGVELRTGLTITSISAKDGHIDHVVCQGGHSITAANYLIATGGRSYPRTGSDGAGFTWAEALGHTVTPSVPALTPVLVEERALAAALEGLSLKNVAITVLQDKKKKDERFGEALFTEQGMSGPIVLDLSRSIGALLPKGAVELRIDFKPALDFEKLDKRIQRDLNANAKKGMKNIMPGLVPGALVPVMLEEAGIDPATKACELPKEQRKKLRNLLKEFPLTVRKLHGFDKAVITRGGVVTREIDPDTMRSKVIDNLFFAGEVIDLDGPTGGYNLQLCWSTGHLAGEAAAPIVGRAHRLVPP